MPVAACLYCLAGIRPRSLQMAPTRSSASRKPPAIFTQMAAFDSKGFHPCNWPGSSSPSTEAIGNPARGNDIVNEPGKRRLPRVPSDARRQRHAGPGRCWTQSSRSGRPLYRASASPDPRRPAVLFPGSGDAGLFQAPTDYQRVPRDLAGKTVLSSQEVEDVVAYLRKISIARPRHDTHSAANGLLCRNDRLLAGYVSLSGAAWAQDRKSAAPKVAAETASRADFRLRFQPSMETLPAG